jgi:hypothetical protein
MTDLANDPSPAIVIAHSEMVEVEEARAVLTAKANEIRATLEEKGINKKAFAAGRIYLKTAPEKREGWDYSYALVRKALDVPVAVGLFDGE